MGYGFTLSLQLQLPVQQSTYRNAVHTDEDHWWTGVVINPTGLGRFGEGVGCLGEHELGRPAPMVALQSGRGNIGKTALQSMPILDVTAFKPEQLENAVKIFDEMCYKQLLPIHQIATDPTRKELDTRFAREVLGLCESMTHPDGPLDLLRKKLAQEPSIRGNK